MLPRLQHVARDLPVQMAGQYDVDRVEFLPLGALQLVLATPNRRAACRRRGRARVGRLVGLVVSKLRQTKSVKPR